MHIFSSLDRCDFKVIKCPNCEHVESYVSKRMRFCCKCNCFVSDAPKAKRPSNYRRTGKR